MKLLTIVVPCYNSQDYMHRCVNSLLQGGQTVEIIIVNDGSTDNTGAIADRYAEKHPATVRVIHQENGGHGAGINAGLAHATGRYFKVVDSDDWVDPAAYKQLLKALNATLQNNPPDMVLSNYVYEKKGKKHKKVMRYTGILPTNKLFTWRDIKRFPRGKYLLMHAIIYRTQMLKDCGLKLPHHTFYVDNLYAFLPLTHVNTMLYVDVDFYRYFIGREGQSVEEKTMIKRIDQQLRVNRLMASEVDLGAVTPPQKQRYMMLYFEIVTMVSSVLLLRDNTAAIRRKKRALWRYIEQQSPAAYKKLRRGFMGRVLQLPAPLARPIALALYTVSRKIVGFN